MAKRPVPKYDFKAFGAAVKAARTQVELVFKRYTQKRIYFFKSFIFQLTHFSI